MSNHYLEPATDHVLVVDTLTDTVIDGVSLPDNIRQQEMISGLVVSIGPEVSKWTKPENIVRYGPYAGKHIVFEGTEFRLLREGQIELYVRKSN